MNGVNIYDLAHSARSAVTMPRIIATALFGAGAIMVHRDVLIAYEASKAADENLATVAAAAAFVKVFLLTGMLYCWNSRKALGGLGTFLSMAACCFSALLFHGYSLASAMDFAFAGRDKVVTAQEQSIEDRTRLQARYAAASARVQASSGSRSVAEIEVDVKKIEAAMASAKTLAASEAANEEAHRKNVYCGDLCKAAAKNKNAAIEDQRKFAPQLEALALELKGARQAEQARAEMAEIDTALAKLKTVGHKDPQAYSTATVLSGLGFSIDPKNAQHVENVGLVKPTLLSLLNEFGATCSFLLAFAFWNARRSDEVSVAPRGGVTELHREPTTPQLPAPMAPVGPSKEQMALEDLRGLIQAHRGRVPDARRQIAAHLEEQTGRKFPVSTFCAWINAWIENKQILVIEEGGKQYLALPFNTRMAVAAKKREMAIA